jgi:site-specific recombinase XerC
MAGVNLNAVQEITGHRTIAMTMRYSHLKPNHLESAMESIAPGPVATKLKAEEPLIDQSSNKA